MSDEPRAYHHGDLRRALLQAALAILDEEQNWEFTLREVARRAGVSHAAPYKHFTDKRELLAAVAAIGFERLAEAMQRAAADETDPLRQLSVMGQAYVAFAVARPAHFRLMFGPTLAGAQYKPLAELGEAAYGLLRQAIQRCADAGHLPAEDVPMRTLAAWAQMHGLAVLLIDGRIGPVARGELSAEQVAAAVARSFAAGFDR